ncbi:MAG: iron-sulfur cluster assembly scaffold protein [Gammaproteobacteria bacterium]
MTGSRYSRAVLESFDNPQHAGRAEGSGPELAVGRAGSPRAGAVIELSLKVAQGSVRQARFRAFGCPHTIAAASRLAVAIEGLSVDALEGFDVRSLAAELDLPAWKLGRLLILEDALAGCIADWKRRQPPAG